MSESIDLDDARSDIENSMTADDRQTTTELRNGQRALDALIAELEGHRARAAEESAAKAERSKRAAELIATVSRYCSATTDREDVHDALDELREMLGVIGG